MFTAAWWSARTHACTRASLCLRGCACECVRVVRMDMQRVAVCWCAAAQRVLHAGQAPSSMRLSDSAALSRSRAFPARPAHRPACIKTADLADRWARTRVDTNDENRALRDISIHEPSATSKPAQTATLLSRGEAPEAEIGTRRRASPVALAVPGTSDTINAHLLSSFNVGSGLGTSWEVRRGAAAGLVGRCQIRMNGAG
jgi:hypothetical protein